MTIIKVFLSFGLTFAIWLLIGGPGLDSVGTLLIFVFLVIHLLVIIWNRATFKIFGGDEFTYGMVSQSLNMLSFFYSLVITFVIFHFYGKSIPHFDDVPTYLWGALTLGMIGSFTIQGVSSKNVSRLPERSNRRVFEKPKSD